MCTLRRCFRSGWIHSFLAVPMCFMRVVFQIWSCIPSMERLESAICYFKGTTQSKNYKEIVKLSVLKRHEISFGVSVDALDWFRSYLTGRSQSVVVDDVLSSSLPLIFGVPQGSVLGPVLFTLYVQPLSLIFERHACDYHKYADDSEFSRSAPPSQFHVVQHCVQDCLGDVLLWMNSNKLKLNPDKTEIMPVGSALNLGSVGSVSTDIGDHKIPSSSCVRYLGVHIDQTLSMQQHISHVCRNTFLALRRIASIRPYLSQSSTARLVSGLITSRLDYCNSSLAGLPAEQIARLQKVQNNAARLIMRRRKHEHVTPLLKELHWLPVKFRIEYKLAVLAYRHFNHSLPTYLLETLTTYEPSCSLRSSGEKLLKVPKTNMKTYCDRSFSSIAPAVWNALPTGLRNASSLVSFKSKLKTFYFQKAF